MHSLPALSQVLAVPATRVIQELLLYYKQPSLRLYATSYACGER